MNADALIIGQYIKAAEFGNTLPLTPTWTIAGDNIEDVPSLKPGAQEGKTVPKGVIFFRDIPRGWVCNKTNVACLKAMFGQETEAWVGKRVTLHAVPVQVGPSKEPGIRVLGSPDITSPVKVTIKLPKRAPITMTMVPTGKPAPTDAPDLPWLLGWLKAGTSKGWTPEAIAELLRAHGSPDGKAATLPADKRREVAAIVKEPPGDEGPDLSEFGTPPWEKEGGQ